MSFRLSSAALAVSLTLAGPALAHTLPLRRYGPAEGLPGGRVNQIVQDGRGFLWFATWDGVARFDGERFRAYGTEDGLPLPFATAIAEDRRGRIWVGTFDRGLALLLDHPRATRFEPVSVGAEAGADSIAALAGDGRGGIWCATAAGLYRSDPEESTRFARVRADLRAVHATSFAEDPDGTLWFASELVLAEIRAATIVDHPLPADRPGDAVAVAAGPRAIVIVCERGVLELVRGDPHDRWTRRELPLVAAPSTRRAATFDDHGTLWIGDPRGLLRVDDRGARVFDTSDGLPDAFVRALARDAEGNLWIGTRAGGVARLSASRIETIGQRDGLTDPYVSSLHRGIDGRLYAVTETAGIIEIERDGARPVPGNDTFAFGGGVTCYPDRRGDWWISTVDGVWRFPGPALRLTGGARLGAREGFPGKGIALSFLEDRSGRLWVGRSGQGLHAIDLSDPRSPRPIPALLPDPDRSDTVRSMTEDRRGRIWVAHWNRLGILEHDRVRAIPAQDGLPGTRVRAILEDARGRIWLALRYGGVSVVDEPDSEPLRFENLGTNDGLSSTTVWSLAETPDGTVWAGTANGLDAIDPVTRRIRHVTVDDGLPGASIQSIVPDRDGTLWLGTSGGVAHLDPRLLPAARVPRTLLTRIEIGGVASAIPETGLGVAPSATMTEGNANIRIDFIAPGFPSERGIRYQVKLEGADADWTAPAAHHVVHYARLDAGSYRFLARAVADGGAVVGEPALFPFTVVPPWWKRPAFVAVFAIALVGGALGWQRARLRRALALERIRRQIATDLHDEVGSGLSQIAILSEVVKRPGAGDRERILDEIAGLARSMRASMADIVWAVDPRKDRLSDLVARMRQAADHLVESAGIRLEFVAPPSEAVDSIPLGPGARRQLLLILKEALHNAVRHSGARNVRVDLAERGGTIVLSIRDDGRGFDPSRVSEGQGLPSLRRRAEDLGARFHLETAPGSGTRLEIEVKR